MATPSRAIPMENVETQPLDIMTAVSPKSPPRPAQSKSDLSSSAQRSRYQQSRRSCEGEEVPTPVAAAGGEVKARVKRINRFIQT